MTPQRQEHREIREFWETQKSSLISLWISLCSGGAIVPPPCDQTPQRRARARAHWDIREFWETQKSSLISLLISLWISLCSSPYRPAALRPIVNVRALSGVMPPSPNPTVTKLNPSFNVFPRCRRRW